MPKSDFTLTIDEVSQRLNKSTRTIHRYKNSGKLSFVVGTTQGNPLLFSRSEVEALARELYPNLVPEDGAVTAQLLDRLARVEQLLMRLERSPLLAALLLPSDGPVDEADAPRGELAHAAIRVASHNHHGEPAERKRLGDVLIQLGSALKQ
jgi:hypothetical protein